MRISSFAQVGFGALMTVGAIVVACGGDNSPSSSGTSGTAASGSTSGTASGAAGTTSGTTTPTSGTTTPTSGTTTPTSGTASGAAGTTSGTAAGASGTTTTVSDASAGGDGGGVCPSTLEDKVTPCDPTNPTLYPTCTKGRGPDLPAGNALKNLGEKTCACTGGTYVCSDCVYETPLPGCYMAPLSPPACAAGVADKATCTAVCMDSSDGADVCQIVSDAGKAEGCVCITGATGPVWTCATLPW